MEFGDRVVLITGGSSGIGLETGRLLSQRGAHVWLAARDKQRMESALRQVEAARRSRGQRCGAVLADVTDPVQATRAVAEVTETCGSPDILVNSAGAVHPGLFRDTENAVMQRLMEVNYFGTVHMTRACLSSMAARQQGHIVNICSVYGFMGGYGYSAYCASKFAIRGFTEALRAELRPLGIRVSIVFPQNTATPQLEYENKLKPDVVRALDDTRVMSPQEVARAIVRGIDRRQYVIIPGAEGKLLFWFSGLSTTALHWVLDRMVDRALKRPRQRQG
ncbi:MAG: SDR family oxidoreductase [Chloroflexi bacterium]|nr:SDR family oxidoreductase [Chloroflexota bacterium]